MGSGIARLLTSHKYPVGTCTAGRSSHTIARATAANVACYENDEALLQASEILISIVPPRDAVATAERVRRAWDSVGKSSEAGVRKLWYLDLNAISPARAREVAAALGIRSSSKGGARYFNDQADANADADEAHDIVFLDGGIIGGPPKKGEDGKWSGPSIPTSGPFPLSAFSEGGSALAEVLSVRHIAPVIGPATGLKMCFASLSKGFCALALQSFASAQAMGVLDEFRYELKERVPAVGQRAEATVTSCPPKAYRWVAEMQEIGACFGKDGGWSSGGDNSKGGDFANVFAAISEVYQVLADKTILGSERIGERQRGTTVEDVAEILANTLTGSNKNKPA